MTDLIQKILLIIDNYRIEDVGTSFQKIDEEHIQTWINQFNEEDREFILSELLHLLPASYLSKENTLRILGNEFETLIKDFHYESVPQFLDETRFIDCQQPDKSQKVLLDFINEILKEKYNYSIAQCGKGTIKNWIYFDDVLASGKTFKDDILNEINTIGKDRFKDSGIRIIASFFILHSWGVKNVTFAIDKQLGYQLGNNLKFYRVSNIDNNPHIHHYYNPSPSFNHAYPKESIEGKEFLDFIEKAFDRTYEMKNERFAFRNPEHPKEEKFYTSPVNRERYEAILLKKGIEIIDSIDDLKVPSIRPLGFTPPSYKTLGTGSHFFTWRNISNTCPLVFWWGANNWHPLFPVKNRGQR